MSEFKCDKCGKIFEQEKSLKQHENDKHLAPQAPEAQKGAYQPQPKAAVSATQVPGGSKYKMKVSMSKNLIIAIVAIVVVAAGGYGAYAYVSGLPASNTPAPADTLSQVSAPIGTLGSTHIHADFALFLDGKEFTPLGPKYFVKIPTVHVETGAGAGSVMHMHATNVPLSFFFKSLGMTFNNQCFTLDNGKEYCNVGDKTLKMYVRHEGGQWEESKKFHTYVFQDLDQILITYGNETDDEIRAQQDSVGSDSAANADRPMDLGGGLRG